MKINGNIKKILSLVFVVVFVAVAFTFVTKPAAGQSTGYESANGYSNITSIAGCIFSVNSTLAEQATAVTQITEGVQFDPAGYYSYKNGKDQYMLFCMDNNMGVVVAAEKGTFFGLADSKDPEEAVKNADIMGIWFDTDKEGLDLKKNGNRCEGHVKAQVVVTNELYNDFIGDIVTLTDGDEEWALFVGTVGDRYKDVSKPAKESIDAIAASFQLSDNTGDFVEEDYAVVIDGSKPQNPEPIEDISETEIPAVSENASQDVEVTPNPDNVSESVSENITVSEDETVSENTPVVSEPTTIPVQETKEEQKEQEKQPSEEVPYIEEQPVKAEENKVATESVVQKTWDDNKAYTSNTYSLLNVGQTGLFETIGLDQSDTLEMMAKITAIQGSKATYESINTARRKNESPFAYFEAPPGCHWESAIYSINYNGTSSKPYINVKIVGADGNKLKYRGIRYSSMTHDLYTGKEEGSWVNDMIVYYAVPNGCTEYVLKIGDGDDINGRKAAYYYIRTNNMQ